MTSGIYKIIAPSGKTYVGQTINLKRRWSDHKTCSRTNSPEMLIHKVMKRYGDKNCSFEILEYCEVSLLDQRETFWIRELNSLVPNGYNQDEGGHSNRELLPSTIEKLRIARLGKPRSEESRRKQAETCTGKKHIQETIEKCKLINKGKVRSEETRKKVSDSKTGVPVHTEGWKLENSKRMKGNTHRRGKKRTPEDIEKQKATRARNKAEAERLRLKEEAIWLQHDMAS